MRAMMRNLQLYLLSFMATLIFQPLTNAAEASVDRSRLPIADARSDKVYGRVPSSVPLSKITDLQSPEGLPDVVVILLDDIGFGAPSPFGGAVEMPKL